MPTPELPDRFVDAENYGWWRRATPEPLYRSPRNGGEELPYEVAAAEYGPVRPVGYPSPGDREALTMALHGAGRKAVTTLLAALGKVWNDRLSRPELGIDSDGAMRSLTAGGAGTWEAAAMEEAVGFGRDLYLEGSKRVDATALETITDILVRWTSGPVHVDLAETLAITVGYIADEYDDDGWKEVADQWLQPESPVHDDVRLVYRWLFGMSGQFDLDLAYPSSRGGRSHGR